MHNVLELLVDEAIPGHFYWTIVWPGAAGELPRVVASAPGPMPTSAWAAVRGQEALRAIQLADEFNGWSFLDRGAEGRGSRTLPATRGATHRV